MQEKKGRVFKDRYYVSAKCLKKFGKREPVYNGVRELSVVFFSNPDADKKVPVPGKRGLSMTLIKQRALLSVRRKCECTRKVVARIWGSCYSLYGALRKRNLLERSVCL